MATEVAYQKRLQELRGATSDSKRRSPLLGASGGSSCGQKSGPSKPPKRPHIDTPEHDPREGGENPVGQDEALDDGAPLPQHSILRPMADSSALASEVDGNRNKRPPLFTLINGVPTSFHRKHNLCVSFNKGRCQHPASHKHAYIVDKFLHHHCGACKMAGQVDAPHGSHELDRCPNRQVFRRK